MVPLSSGERRAQEDTLGRWRLKMAKSLRKRHLLPGQPLLDHTGQMLLGLKDLNLHRFAQLFRLLPSRVTKQPSKRPMMLQMTSSVWDMGELFVHLFCHDNETNLILITNYKRCSGHQHGADAHWEKSHLTKSSLSSIFVLAPAAELSGFHSSWPAASLRRSQR